MSFHATGSSVFYIANSICVNMYRWVFYFMITASLRSKGNMDHTSVLFFAFVKVLYAEYKNQSTTDGYKSHFLFLVIANRKTNKGWFVSLFVFPIEWYQTETQRTAYIEHLACLFFLFWCCEWKTKIATTDHISIFPFLIFNEERVKEAWLSFSYFLLWNRKAKNERTVYAEHDAFPFFLFSSCKETCITDHMSILRYLFMDWEMGKGCWINFFLFSFIK